MTDQEQRQLVAPFCFTFAAAIWVAILLYEAVEIDGGHVKSLAYRGGRNAALMAATRGLAEMLGLVGSIVFSVLLVGALAAWLVVSYRRVVRARPAKA